MGQIVGLNAKCKRANLNKMLICTDSEAQEWRDFNGNIINSQSN